jgi:hypothetical protein
MYLNLIGLGFVGLCLSYLVYQFFKPVAKVVIPQRSGLLVAQDTGKSKQIQSKTGDASMQVELRRRRAIQALGRIELKKIKESTYQKGSTTGALETFFISGICPPIEKIIENLLYDAGGACDDYCSVLEDTGSGPGYDAGDANAPGCDVAPLVTDYDAGGACDDYCSVLEDTGVGPGYDAGNANAPECDVAPLVTDYDGGEAYDDFCSVLEDTGVGPGYDAGNANAPDCENPIIGIGYDAGVASTDYCDVLEDIGTGGAFDAGTATTRVCDN